MDKIYTDEPISIDIRCLTLTLTQCVVGVIHLVYMQTTQCVVHTSYNLKSHNIKIDININRALLIIN